MPVITTTPFKFIEPSSVIAIRLLGGVSTDVGFGITIDNNNDICAVGYTISQGQGSTDALIAKYDSNGDLLWQRTYGGGQGEEATSVATDSSNDIYITGHTATPETVNDDLFLVKYNSSGTLQWQRYLHGTNSEHGNGIVVDTSNNVYTAGYTDSQGLGGPEILLTKWNSSGTLQWQRRLGASSSEIARGLAIDSSANIYFAGYTGTDLCLGKYDTNGTLQWQRKLSGASNESAYGITVDTSSNVYVVGDTNSSGAGGIDMLIAKYNSSGVLQWQRTLGGAGTDRGNGVITDSNGNVYVTGITASQGQGGAELLVVKYNSAGVLQWQRILGGTGTDIGYAIDIDSSGRLYIAGITNNAGVAANELLLVRLADTGNDTGTYGAFTYQVSTLTDSVCTLTDSATSFTSAATTLAPQTGGLTSATSTLTETVVV